MSRSLYTRLNVSEEDSLKAESDTGIADIDEGRQYGHNDEECGSELSILTSTTCSLHTPISHDLREGVLRSKPKWTRRRRFLKWNPCGSSPGDQVLDDSADCVGCGNRRRPLRFLLRCLALMFMLLGLIEFVFLMIAFVGSFFPEDAEYAYARWRPHRPQDPTSHWPTDYTADLQPVRCHSHNDYWRPVPLRSAVEAGCTGVEADVWLFPDRSTDELFVGHSKASLTPARTFKSLYINPLVEILELQNPITPLHPELDSPRNGVFDTDPEQTLVLLVDFKTDGQELWSYVSEQLEPLRQRKYLTYFNGTSTIAGPITVVATGNAPFNKVVQVSHYRDIFFDAPLDLMANIAPNHAHGPGKGHAKPSVIEDLAEDLTAATAASVATARPPISGSSNQGQGYSGAAPKNAAVYNDANSYYASVSFGSSIGHALPFLTMAQREKIRQQIRGAHKQGLKVRYWDTPSWPIGLRNYIWRVLVEEGVDYLNVDDLRAATRGEWGRPRRRHRWSLSYWSLWSRR